MNGNNERAIIYILTNESMPDIVKVGVTNTTIEQRMQELYKTGVPVPFECFHASVVENALEVEGRIHRAFDKYRVNQNREFFEIPPENILDILEMVEIENVTPRETFTETDEDKTAIDKLEKRSHKFNFKLYNIPIGATLTFVKDETKESVVTNDNNVIYNNEELSLSYAALEALKELGYDWQRASGPVHWKYQGETLSDRRTRMESE